MNCFTLKGLVVRIVSNFAIIIVIPAIAYWLYVNCFQYEISDNLRNILMKLPGEVTILNGQIMECSFCAYTILVSFLVLFCNTLYSYINYIREGERKRWQGTVVGCLYPLWLIVALVAATFLVAKNINTFGDLSKFDSFETKFTDFVKDTGIFALCLYIGFVLIDFFQFLSVKNRPKLERDLSLHQLLFVDIATLVGFWTINHMTVKVDITTLNVPLNVFISGATGMQVILSQFVFFLIFTLYNIEMYRYQKEVQIN